MTLTQSVKNYLLKQAAKKSDITSKDVTKTKTPTLSKDTGLRAKDLRKVKTPKVSKGSKGSGLKAPKLKAPKRTPRKRLKVNNNLKIDRKGIRDSKNRMMSKLDSKIEKIRTSKKSKPSSSSSSKKSSPKSAPSPKKSTPSFGKAFSSARGAGKKNFKWKGKKYHTKTKEDLAKDKSSSKKTSPAPKSTGSKKKSLSPFEKSFSSARSAGKKNFKFKGKKYHTKTKEDLARAKKSTPKKVDVPKLKKVKSPKVSGKGTHTPQKSTPKGKTKVTGRVWQKTTGTRATAEDKKGDFSRSYTRYE